MNIVYREAALEDLPEIVRLHKENFEGYFLTSLGEDMLAAYYKEFIDEGCFFVVAEDLDLDTEHKMVGFYMGHYRNSKAKTNFERHNRKTLIKRLLVLCLKCNKDALSRCFGRVKGKFSRKKKDDKPQRDAVALSQCVDPAYRSTPEHIAYNLYKKGEALMLQKAPFPIRVYGGVTKQNNLAFQKFMKKVGGEIVCEANGGESYMYLHFLDPSARQEWIDAGILKE